MQNLMDHTELIANLKELDAAWLKGLRAAGFVKNGSRMVHKKSGVFATRMGYQNGYVHRFAGQNVYADTVADVTEIVAAVVALTK